MWNVRNIIAMFLLLILIVLVVISTQNSRSPTDNNEQKISVQEITPEQNQNANEQNHPKTLVENKEKIVSAPVIRQHRIKKHSLLWACVAICLTIAVCIFLTKKFFDHID